MARRSKLRFCESASDAFPDRIRMDLTFSNFSSKIGKCQVQIRPRYILNKLYDQLKQIQLLSHVLQKQPAINQLLTCVLTASHQFDSCIIWVTLWLRRAILLSLMSTCLIRMLLFDGRRSKNKEKLSWMKPIFVINFTYTVNGCQRKIRINHPKHEQSGEIKAYNPGTRFNWSFLK